MKTRSTQIGRLSPALLVACGVLAALLVPVALAAPSGPDASFGANGLVLTDFSHSDDVAQDLALQPDGKIVVVGYANNGQDDDWAVARYNTDGSLDPTFGAGGIVTTTFGASDEWAYGVALQPDGKIVVAGTARVSDTLQGVYDLALARYTSNGALDPTFGGGDGKVTTDDGEGWNDFGYAVVLQADKIIVVGSTSNLDGPRIALARYTSDGSLDATFNGGGLAAIHDGCEARAVALQPNDWIVVAGVCIEGGFDFGLARFNPNGYPDTAFGVDGLVRTDIYSEDVASDVLIQPDGQIVAVGDSGDWYGGCDAPQDLALARYSSIDGSLDPTFGVGGVITTDLGLGGQPGLCKGKELGFAAALQSDGKIVVGGKTGAGSRLPGYGGDDFILVRYHPNGSLDTAFGAGGAIISPLSGLDDSAAQAVVIQPDGKFVIAGWITSYPQLDFLVARYHAAFAAYLPLVLRDS